MRRLALVLVLCTCAFGCSTTRAAAPPERPVLVVPLPPPRIVEAPPVASVPREPLVALEPVPDLEPSSPAVTAKPRVPRELPPKDTQKSEVTNEVAVADPAAAAPPASPPPAPLLRTPATADPAAAEHQIRATLGRASKLLSGVDYTRASELRKKAYNEVNDFIAQAQAAMKASNFELGRELAEKAEKFARELQGR